MITYSLFGTLAQLKVSKFHILVSSCVAECKSLKTAEWILMKCDIGKFYNKIDHIIQTLLKIGQDEVCGFLCSS